MKHLASYIRGAMVTGKKHIARSYFNGLASSLHGHFWSELSRLFFAEWRRNQRSPNGSWGHAVNAYSSFNKLQCKPSGECHNGSFCCRVVKQLRVSLVCNHWCCVDYGAPFIHMPQWMPVNHYKHSWQIYKLRRHNLQPLNLFIFFLTLSWRSARKCWF